MSKRGAGVSVKMLKEPWRGSAKAIKESEKKVLILAIRAGKDDEKKAIFVAQSRTETEEMMVDNGWVTMRQLPSSFLTCMLFDRVSKTMGRAEGTRGGK